MMFEQRKTFLPRDLHALSMFSLGETSSLTEQQQLTTTARDSVDQRE